MEIISNEELRQILTENYALNPETLDKSSWGYNTVAYYAKSNGKDYMIRITPYTEDKAHKTEKDIYLSTLLKDDIPTSFYIKNANGSYMTNSRGYILKISTYTAGTSPFEMNMDIYKQVIDYLHLIHCTQLSEIMIDLPKEENGTTFLHGDLTPSNIVVDNNRIKLIIDFEDSLLGPAEYDLARSAVFCWFRMKDIPFRDVFDFTTDRYPHDVDSSKLHSYAVLHAQRHLDQVMSNKGKYDDELFWNDDFNFSSKALNEVKEVSTL